MGRERSLVGDLEAAAGIRSASDLAGRAADPELLTCDSVLGCAVFLSL